MIENKTSELRTMLRSDRVCLHMPILGSVRGGMQGTGVSTVQGYAPINGRGVAVAGVDPKFVPSFADGVRSASLDPPV